MYENNDVDRPVGAAQRPFLVGEKDSPIGHQKMEELMKADNKTLEREREMKRPGAHLKLSTNDPYTITNGVPDTLTHSHTYIYIYTQVHKYAEWSPRSK